ncbi:hypothetical protein BS47DRAFT_1402813 [Hydnum rufescens UP504]|uniref:Uncharacterized protein n=1 Tax=Hydnum rufescens UP504 TaxID=1448309 RepID=A0A9P6ABG6_9AGAM|nr:hypothetical protein BS47DRAFT_1402813 [Hydnum rufescens UP504]
MPLKEKVCSFLLDVVEVAKSHSGKNLPEAFHNILLDFDIEDKVCIPFVKSP